MDLNIDNLPVPAIICNIQTGIHKVNKLFTLLTGYDENSFANKTLLNITSPEYKQTTFDKIKNCLNGINTNFLTRIIRKDSKEIYSLVHCALIDKTENKVLVVLCDITEFKHKEAELLDTIIASEERERRRVAMELHDNLSPILSAINLYINLLKNKTPDETKELINNIEQLIKQAITTSKEISYNITPSILHDFGLAEAIKKFANLINQTRTLEIEVKSDNYNITERIMAESILYQAAKELINNTIKHANATKIFIELRSTKNRIYLYYRDDGKGFNINQILDNGKGLGLRNIIHKVNSLKGTCDFYSEKDKGFVALINVPIQKSNKIKI